MVETMKRTKYPVNVRVSFAPEDWVFLQKYAEAKAKGPVTVGFVIRLAQRELSRRKDQWISGCSNGAKLFG